MAFYLAIAAFFAVLVAVAAFSRPEAFILVAPGLCLVPKTLVVVTGISQFDSLDEGAIVLAVACAVWHRLQQGAWLRAYPGMWWILAYLGWGVASDLVQNVPLDVTTQGTFIAAKASLLALALAQVDWTEKRIVFLVKLGAVVLLFMFLAGFLNLLYPAQWFRLFDVAPDRISYRSIIPSLIGPFPGPGDLGIVAATGLLAVTTWRRVFGRSNTTTALWVGSAISILLSFRRAAWVGAVAGLFWIYSKSRALGALLVATLGLLLVGIAFGALLGNFFGQLFAIYIHQTAGVAGRTLMTRDSLSIAANYFPFGAGFGRFGSSVAASHYSPEYSVRGYSAVWGLSKDTGNDRFLTDTMWPNLIGESGFIGASFFALALVSVWRRAKYLATSQTPLIRWLGLTAGAWLVLYLVESIGSPVFVAPPLYIALFAFMGISGGLTRREQAVLISAP